MRGNDIAIATFSKTSGSDHWRHISLPSTRASKSPAELDGRNELDDHENNSYNEETRTPFGSRRSLAMDPIV